MSILACSHCLLSLTQVLALSFVFLGPAIYWVKNFVKDKIMIDK